MKPISLVIDGINSFYDRQEVDFRFDGLFCISGDTGSGKTTILDCIIIALFGDGNRASVLNDYINLRRDKAEIRFIFEATADGERHEFEVIRSLSRTSASRARLLDRTSGVTLAEQATAVNAKLKEIIGLTKEDFTQMVILEQGKFAKFLSASKKDRNETVGNLFKLHKYKDLGSKFKSRMNDLKRDIDNIDERLGELKGVTQTAVDESERGIRGMLKRAKELEEAEHKNAKEIETLVELRRIYEKCIDAQKKLIVEQEEEKKLILVLTQCKERAAETASLLKAATEQKAASELVVARANDLRGFIDERKKRNDTLNELLAEWRKADGEEKAQAKEYEQSVEKAQKLSSMLNSTLNDVFSIADFGEKDGYCDVFDLKSKSEMLKSEYATAKARYAEFDKKVLELSAKVKGDSNTLLAIMEQAKAQSDRLDTLKKELYELRLRREQEQRLQAAQFIQEGLKEGDVCPVCGGKVGKFEIKQTGKTAALLAQKEAEVSESEGRLKELENNRYSFATRLEEGQKALATAQKELEMAKERLAKIEEIIIVPAKIDTLVELVNEACELQRKLTFLDSEAKVAKQKHEAASARAADIKERGKAERAEVIRLDELISQKLTVSEEELSKSEQKLDNLRQEVERLTELLSKQEVERDAQSVMLAACEARIKLLKEEAENKPVFDLEALEKKLESEKQIKIEREELIAHVARDQKELEVIKERLGKKRGLEADKAQFKNKYDIYADIYKLVSGDKFIEYIAEEYILQFTASASMVLNDITGGKYTLEYESGAFMVKDFLAGGEKRKAGTLSGGETFLASLSLAIAISREIARYKTYEFFFLDEGFGTLDSYSLDTVMSALNSLATDTLVGIVTHRSELTERIFDKITVLSAGADRGSVIVRSD